MQPLNSQNVVDRISQGDCPIVESSYSYASRFDDGTQVPHQTMQIAADRMGLASPGRNNRWVVRAVAQPI